MTQTGKKSIKKFQIENSFNTENLTDDSNSDSGQPGEENEIPNYDFDNSNDNDNFIRGIKTTTTPARLLPAI